MTAASANHHEYPSDVAFTPAVKAIQEQKKSRASYARMESARGWQTWVTPDLAEFLADLDMFYLGTANAQGQLTSNIVEAHPVFSKLSMSTRWGSPTLAATGST
jgi:hypothetical protein